MKASYMALVIPRKFHPEAPLVRARRSYGTRTWSKPVQATNAKVIRLCSLNWLKQSRTRPVDQQEAAGREQAALGHRVPLQGAVEELARHDLPAAVVAGSTLAPDDLCPGLPLLDELEHDFRRVLQIARQGGNRVNVIARHWPCRR